MKKLFIKVVIIIMVTSPSLALSQQKIDIKGWNKAEWGMLESDLMNQYKDVIIKCDKRQYLNGDGLYTDMKIEGLKINEVTFDIFFEMGAQDNRLKRVRLIKYYPASSLDFNQFERLITSRYGNPTYREEEKQGRSLASWLLPFTKIDLEYNYYNAYVGKVMEIIYSDRAFVATGNEKL